MVLANFNVEKCLIEQIKSYVTNNNWTFEQLKNLILSKKPIVELQIRIDALLLKTLATDIEKIKQTLEAEIYKNQQSEDEQEKKKEQLQKAKDDQLKERFNQELKKISQSIDHYIEEQHVLTQRMNQSSLSQIALSHYPPQSNQWQYTIQQYAMKIQFLSEKRKIIRDKLHGIEQRSNIYTQREQARDLRKQASIAYQNTQQNITSSLSEKNKELLRKNLNAHKDSLTKRKAQLSLESERIYFSLFLQQLCESLPLMPLNPKEITALQAIVKLSQKQNQHQNDLILFQDHLNKKKSLISNLLVQLHELKEKLRLLSKQNPFMTQTPEAITEKIKALNSSLTKNSQIQSRINTISLLMLGLTSFFSIPLILALSGKLSFFTPVILYCLVSIPPALFLLAALSLGIASLVYFFKTRENTEAIKNNKLLISSNFKQESKKEFDIKELDLVTIPTLEQKIKKEETLRDELFKTVEKTKKQLKDTLHQAQQITPASTVNLSLFKINIIEPLEPEFDPPVLLAH